MGDADANGLLSLAEVRTMVPSLSEADFSDLDRNNDGNLCEGERAALRAPIGGYTCPGKVYRPVSL